MSQSMNQPRNKLALVPFAIALLMTASAASARTLGTLVTDGVGVWWELQSPINYDHLVLTVATPDGAVERLEFDAGVAPSYDAPESGTYTYELHAVPRGVAKAAAKGKGKPLDPEEAMDENGRPISAARNFTPPRGKRGAVQSGYFTVGESGLIETGDLEEE